MRKRVEQLTESEKFSLAVAAGVKVKTELVGNRLVFTTHPVAVFDDGTGYRVAMRKEDSRDG